MGVLNTGRAFKDRHTGIASAEETRSGKILHRTMKKIAGHDSWTIPASTIRPPASLGAGVANLRTPV